MHFVPINFSGPGFDPVYTADFELLLILNQQTFSYAVRHPATKKLVRASSGNLLSELWEPGMNPEVTGAAYQKVIVAVETQSFCLVPDAVFTPEDLLSYTAFMLVKEVDVILIDQMENGQNTVIFTFPEDLVRKTTTQFNTSAIQFAPKSWIKTMVQTQLPGQNLYLFLEENHLQILFPEGNNIRFYNQFDCSSLDELVYYTALVANQLTLKSAETNLVLCGRIEAGGEQMLRLQRFFKEVTLFNTSDLVQNLALPQHQMVQFLGLS